MQTAWVERLFGRLQAIYGASFGRQWDGTDVREVKAVWAEKLGGFTAPDIAGALRACEDRIAPDGRSYPPNVPEFVGMCRDAARRNQPAFKALPAPEISREEIEARARQIESIVKKRDGRDYKLWAKQLRERYLSGDRTLSLLQVKSAADALHEAWENGQCSPVMGAAA